MDYALQRKTMVDSQVRPSDVTDRRIIRAMLDIAREEFVPASARETCYRDGPVVLTAAAGHRGVRELLAPRTEAKLLELAAIEADDAVLIVGAGSGYSAALVGRLARSVTALESATDLAGLARAAVPKTGASGDIAVVEGELPDGWAPAAPYDVIFVAGAIAVRPDRLLEQLKDGGRLIAIEAAGPGGKAVVWRRTASTYSRFAAFDAGAALLPGFEKAAAFAF